MESVWFCWGGNGGATYKSEDGADAGRCGFGVDGFAIGKTKVRFRRCGRERGGAGPAEIKLRVVVQ